MSPMVSWFACFIALPAVGFVIIEFAIRSYFRPTSKEEKKTITAILVLTGLLTYYLFTDKAPTPPAPYTEHNAAMLATIEAGDLVLCTDPETGQIEHMFLVQTVAEDLLYGTLIDRVVMTIRLSHSDFNKCQAEVFRDNGLGSVDRKIGEVIRSRLNPPPPK